MGSKKPWTKEELKLAKKGIVPPGRSERSTDRVRKKKRYSPKAHNRKRWSKRKIGRLRNLHRKGLSAIQIAQQGLLPHSVNAIQKMLGRLGLAKKVKIIKLSSEQRDKLRSFLKENYVGKTPEDLARMWEEKYPMLPPAGYRRVVSYLTELGIKMPYWEVCRINNARRREEKAKEELQKKHASVKQIDEAVRLSRIEFMRSRLERGMDIWSGEKLPPEILEEWSEICKSEPDSSPENSTIGNLNTPEGINENFQRMA